MNLHLGDSFDLFVDYDINEQTVKLSQETPDRIQALSNNFKLYIKSFTNSDSKKTQLLMGTQLVKEKEILAFAFWVPSILITKEAPLIDILELFANQFGLRIKIGNDEGYLIKYSEKLLLGKLDDPISFVKILAPDQVPCQWFFSTSESSFGTFNKVAIHYAFSLNTGKYNFWVNSHRVVSMQIKSGWYDFVKDNFINYVQPHGQTKIEIQKQRTNEGLELDNSKSYTSIEIPEIYQYQFSHILNQINNLRNDEKILFKISFESPKCLFCNSDNITKEHIFPKWIRPYLNETIFDGTVFTNPGTEPLDKIISSATTPGKQESSHGYTAKLVCAKCNNTWMSHLEEQVQSILVKDNKLITEITDDISLADATTLAQWLIVKSLVLSNKLFSNIHLIKKDIFEKLVKGHISNGFLVEVTSATNSKFDYIVGRGLLHENSLKLNKISQERGRELASNFFTCTVQLNHLLFRVSYLEPEIPLVREISMKETLVLFPFKQSTIYRSVPNGQELWKKVIDDNLELHLFGIALILRERE